MIRILLADDQPLVRSGLQVLFGGDQSIEVVGEATNGQEAVALARQLLPDVVVMDIRMPVLDGLQATRQIVSEAAMADVKILVLTTFEIDEYVFDALRAGASGFLLKDAEPSELLHAIAVLHAGEALLSPSVTRRLINRFVDGPAQRAQPQELAALTTREREIMGLVAQGMSNDEIAQRLTISPATAKTHVSRAMLKVGARDRAQLVVLAYQTGLAPGR